MLAIAQQVCKKCGVERAPGIAWSRACKSWCLDCYNKYQREYYHSRCLGFEQNERVLERKRAVGPARRTLVYILMSRPCSVCGVQKDQSQMRMYWPSESRPRIGIRDMAWQAYPEATILEAYQRGTLLCDRHYRERCAQGSLDEAPPVKDEAPKHAIAC